MLLSYLFFFSLQKRKKDSIKDDTFYSLITLFGHRFYAGQLLLLLVIVCTAVKSSSIYNILDNATLEVKIYWITKCTTTGYFLPIFSSILKKSLLIQIKGRKLNV